jgi:hypothetical protein
MAEAADTEHGEALSTGKIHLPEGPVDSHAGAQERCCLNRGKVIGNPHCVACWRLYILRVAAVDRDTRDLLLQAKVFVALAAEFTFTARIVNPRDAYAVSDFEVPYRRASLDHAAGDFVTQDQRLFDDSGQLHPVAVGHMQVRMTNPAGFDFDQYLIGVGLGPRNLFDGEGRLEFVEDGGSHRRTWYQRSSRGFVGQDSTARRKNSTAL